MIAYQTLLKQLIQKRSFQQHSTPKFTLASGKKSCFYFNLKPVTYSVLGLEYIGQVVYEQLQEQGWMPDAIGGLTMGADPIAVATAKYSYDRNFPIQSFSIRKEPKSHGTCSQIEGYVEPGQDVVIAEDVITTGGSTIKAISTAFDYGLDVLGVIALVDRCEENGRQNIEKLNIPVCSVFTIEDFMK